MGVPKSQYDMLNQMNQALKDKINDHQIQLKEKDDKLQNHGYQQREHQEKIGDIEHQISKKQEHLEAKEEEVVRLRNMNRELSAENAELQDAKQQHEDESQRMIS